MSISQSLDISVVVNEQETNKGNPTHRAVRKHSRFLALAGWGQKTNCSVLFFCLCVDVKNDVCLSQEAGQKHTEGNRDRPNVFM